MSTWTCQRVSESVKCGHVNPGRKQLCEACGKRRPPRRRPAHTIALDIDYATYALLNGGERCAICGAEPKPGRRLQRDHDHRTGYPRGLLCFRCNRQLPTWATIEWMRAALAYLERTSVPE